MTKAEFIAAIAAAPDDADVYIGRNGGQICDPTFTVALDDEYGIILVVQEPVDDDDDAEPV